ncbi:TonB-dependent receptor [Niveispirillum sp.]|uniref:TonB-dependent receptor n=1 Tax=Niveispirillum sp. TaxID=1917217 RepID=UPI001B4D03A0|nr:TonB-dependent receptor [Niveispirillum sp.]MBP7334243.1 TonB-dependent receptor [Niveispirillum sp.]
MKKSMHPAVLSCGVALFALISVSAHAQDAGASDGLVLEEIVVTAQRRAQTLADVPLSVSVLGGETLAAAGVNRLDDVARMTPNFQVVQGSTPQQNRFTVRGLTSSTSNQGIDPSVGFFVDGVYIARSEAVLTQLQDVERIEVLRGPQGTLYGKNTTVGAVNVITKRPGNNVEGQAIAEYGNYDSVRLQGRVAGPLVEDVAAASLSGFYSDRDGYTTNIANGEKLGSLKTYGGRAKLALDPSEAVAITLIADYQRDEGYGSTADLRRRDGVPTDIYDYRTSRSAGEVNDMKTYGFSGQIDWELGPLTLRSITAHRGSKMNNVVDSDSTETAFPFGMGYRIADASQTSEEIQLFSPDSERFRYIVGGFYLHQKLESKGGLVIPATGVRPLDQTFNQSGDSYAVFGQANYDIVDALTLTVGGRYSHETRDATIAQTAPAGVGYAIINPALNRSSSESDFSPLVSLNYKLDRNLSVYATYAEGVKSGGFNAEPYAGTATTVGQTLAFEPEHATSYEVGLKSMFWQRRASLNLALYRMSFDDLQVSTFNGVAFSVANAASARSTGVELEGSVTPVRGLTLTGSVGYSRAKYRDFIFKSSAAAAGVDLSGRQLGYAPKWTGAASAQYETDLGAQMVGGVRVDYQYAGEQTLSAFLDPRARQASVNLFNGRLYVQTDGGFEVALWGKNLFNKHYLLDARSPLNIPGTSADDFGGVVSVPRTYGVTLTKRF